jgi:hypothetical protein
MDIERLKELKSEVSNMAFIAFSKLTDKNARANIVKTGNDLQKLIDKAIARQSVKSEEVQEAISWAQGMEILYEEEQMPSCADCAKTAVVALQAYQPWVSVSERLPESGKHILLCCEVRPSGKRYVCDGYYATSKSITSGYSSECDCEYDEETDEYYLPEGYYEIIKNWDDYSSITIEDFVTHYKPLPEPPKGE